MCICSFLEWKNACLNYREFNLEDDLVGVPHTWYLSAQSFIRLLKLVWSEYDIVAMNEWKKKCVGLQRTWLSKRTVEKTHTICLTEAGSHKISLVEAICWVFMIQTILAISLCLWLCTNLSTLHCTRCALTKASIK